MKNLTVRVCLGKDGMAILPPIGAFDVVHAPDGSVKFYPIEPCDNIELDFDFPDEPEITVPAESGVTEVKIA